MSVLYSTNRLTKQPHTFKIILASCASQKVQNAKESMLNQTKLQRKVNGYLWISYILLTSLPWCLLGAQHQQRPFQLRRHSRGILTVAALAPKPKYGRGGDKQ